MMYKIGDFSKITSFTVKALRYYDEEGLLQPSQILENGYRLYDEKDFEIAMRIKLLKDLSFSISEIKDVLLNTDNDEDLQDYLIEKRKQIEKHILSEKEIIKLMNTYLSPEKQKEGVMMKYEMSFQDIDEQLVMSYRFQGAYPDVGLYSPKLYKAAKNKVDGNMVTLYYDEESKDEADMELCLPIKEKVQGTDAKIKVLPNAYVLSTTHIGKYENLRYAYKALLDYAQEHHLELLRPSREIYKKGPGMLMKGNPDKYVTEIQIPIQKG